MTHITSQGRRRVAITGLGAVTPLGLTTMDTWSGLVDGRSGVGPITRFDPTGCPVQFAAEVKGFEPAAAILAPEKAVHPRGAGSEAVTAAVSQKDAKKLGRFTHLGLAAALQAYADSGLDQVRDQIRPERMGVNMGVGLGGLPEIEGTRDAFHKTGYRRISPFFILQVAPNILSGQTAILLDCRGPNMSNTAACATSGHSLGESLRVIQRGEADVMIAGGSEAAITPLAVGAFAQMRALSTRNDAPTAASRPYDRDRDGFVIGEGSVVFVLEELEHAKRRGARIYAELVGYAATGDAYHLSSLAPEAEGSRRAMQLALDDGQVNAADVDYVSAHATSTPGGDAEEGAAIASVFAPAKERLHVSGIKSMTGHLLGGAGAFGCLAAVLAVHHGVIPPTINLENVDPACAALGLNFTPNKAVEKPVRRALANAFGFGGTNSSLVVAKI
ncbi:beta-ketoacyl-[acyl-carrier-protein] synthase II [Opitutaceae bacterium EW11]|nr:beta-ketoacyl-[acyl-carrier-protein] synthase II [Opitutaceae bacterium EW11]